MKEEEIIIVLQSHKLWMEGAGGQRANLGGAYLSGADLSRANLSGADLSGANLGGADLSRADLSRANLSGADLSGANLGGAYLSGADLGCTNLRDANLSGADLSGANLSRANLSGANLSGANLGGAYLSGANLGCTNLRDANLSWADLRDVKFNEETAFFAMTCPEKGSFIGYKKVNNTIVELLIPAESRRSSATTRKCRCEFAKVLTITNIDGSKANIDKIANDNYAKTIYSVGEMVYPDKWDDDRWNECTHGIHFFITREEAVNYK